MTLRGTLRILVSKWYVVIAGLLLSLTLAGFVFTLVPAEYTSSGVAVLVQPRRPGLTPNPLLNFDASLSTTALMVVQDLDTPQAGAQLGIQAPAESYTIEQASADASFAAGPVVQPFISINTKASTAGRSAEMVDGLLAMARQDLVDRQKELRVPPQNYIRLQQLGYTSPPKRALAPLMAATGAALVIGLCLTLGSVLLLDALERRRGRAHGLSAPAAGQAGQLAPAQQMAFGDGEYVTGPAAGHPAASNGTRAATSRSRG